MLLANKKAPFSRTSNSMVAVWACSVVFMSCHDSSASVRSRLSTVCTTACRPQRAHLAAHQHTHARSTFTSIIPRRWILPPELLSLLRYVRHITILFHTYNSFNGNFDGFIGYSIYWRRLLDESCNSFAQGLSE